MFNNSHNVHIGNGTFVSAGGNCIVRESSYQEHGWTKLEQHIVPGAVHNSAELSDAPRCHPETRLAVQSDIMSWITHGDVDCGTPPSPHISGDVPKNVMWVTGPAGTGKTAILTSVAEQCHTQGVLAASFFFSSRHARRNSKDYLVPTLAYQIGQSIKALRPVINQAVEEDGTVFSKNLKTQVDALIVRPVYQLLDQGAWSRVDWPKAVIIDALDECGPNATHSGRYSIDQEDRDSGHLEILSALLAAATLPDFPFRILIASRPERVIRMFFLKTPTGKECTHVLSLDEKYKPDADIALLLRCKFADIRRRYGIAAPWPAENVIRILVDKASGQFIYAATVLRFIQNAKRSPQEQLEVVLDAKLPSAPSRPRRASGSAQGSPGSPQTEPLPSFLNPFAQLDALYIAILQSTPDPTTSAIWLHIIDYFSNTPQYDFSKDYKSARRNLRGVAYSAAFVNTFMEVHSGDAERVLGNLHSVLHVPDLEVLDHGSSHANSNIWTTPYSFHHKSMVEFLKHPLRSGQVYIREDVWRAHLFTRYLVVYRAPNPSLPHVATPTGSDFTSLCSSLTVFDYLRFLQDPNLKDALLHYDIEWWAKHQCSHKEMDNISLFYKHVHSMCTWYRCTKLCRRWRRSITRAMQNAGLPTPSELHRLRNRFQPTTAFEFGQ